MVLSIERRRDEGRFIDSQGFEKQISIILISITKEHHGI